MPCDLNEMLQRQFYFFGTYFMEESILACWQEAVEGAEVVIDVGANAGIYSLAALAIEPTAVVHAFEPTLEVAERLRLTAKMNGLNRLFVHELAVYSENGYAALHRFRGDYGTNEGMNYISRDTDNPKTERVQTICLDQFCKDQSIDCIDLLKLDIQGQEHSALVGAKKLIEGGRIKIIFLELNWAENAGVDCAAISSIQLLEQAGYLFSKPEQPLAWRESGDWLRALSDVVACRVNSEQKL
jgi:FkbM family methyltransferase